MSATVVSLDFRAAGVPNRFRMLDRLLSAEHVPLEPPAGQWATVPRYVEAMLERVSVPDQVGALIVVYCVAYGLAGAVVRALHCRGAVVYGVLAVDPVLPDAGSLREAYGTVLSQLTDRRIPTAAEEAWSTDRADVYDDLDRLVHPLAAPLPQRVYESLGLVMTDDAAPEAQVADDLTMRYQTWLRHLAACYAAAHVPIDVPVTVLISKTYNISEAGLAGGVASAALRCSGEMFRCECLLELVERLGSEARDKHFG